MHRVSDLRDRYEEQARLTGERFNLFKILDRSRAEVKTHSRFIAELLNPKGSHNQDDIFLKLFLEHVNLERKEFDCSYFPTKYAQVKVERSHGTIVDKDLPTVKGGRVDIEISFKTLKKRIIIENKIDAPSQPEQLLRYYNTYDSNCQLIYLTLSGESAPVSSTGNNSYLESTCIDISYCNTIRNWLEACLLKVKHIPKLSSLIEQYHYLICDLTNQTPNHLMSTEVAKILAATKETVATSISISNSLGDMKKILSRRFLNTLLKTKLFEGCVIDPLETGIPYPDKSLPGLNNDIGFSIKHDVIRNHDLFIFIDTKDWNCNGVGLKPFSADYDRKKAEDLNFWNTDEKPISDFLNLYCQMEDPITPDGIDSYTWYMEFSEYPDWMSQEAWVDIADGDKVALSYIDEVNDLLKYILEAPPKYFRYTIV